MAKHVTQLMTTATKAAAKKRAQAQQNADKPRCENGKLADLARKDLNNLSKDALNRLKQLILAFKRVSAQETGFKRRETNSLADLIEIAGEMNELCESIAHCESLARKDS